MFIILMLIFILQSVWLYITELAGKDLEIDIIIKFLIYVSPRIIVLVLPLTILLTSIMVFGRFAENYEFAAMKSTGISLQRAMRSLSIFIISLSVLTFFFANNVIPTAEFNFYNLRKNIAKKKPTMAIAKGQFNEIGDLINIKVNDKSGDKGQFLEGVVVHKKKKRNDGNYTVIVAETGELRSDDNSDILELILYNGYYHEDLQPSDYQKKTKNNPHIKSWFEKNTFLIDLSEINNVDFSEQNVTSRYTMLNAKELTYTIDSLKIEKKEEVDKLAFDLYGRSGAGTLNSTIQLDKIEIDSSLTYEQFMGLLQPRHKAQIFNLAENSINSTIQIIKTKKKAHMVANKNLNKHITSYYDKFALGIVCIILFFIGAPLGALIKKGGVGLPIVVAIILFLTYHFIGIAAKNSSEDDSISPVLASWLSTIIMFPLSIYFTSRATKDRTLVDLDAVLLPIKNILTKEAIVAPINTEAYLEEGSSAYENLDGYTDKKLIDVLKNYRQYDLDESYRNTAIKLLEARGITEEELRFGGNLKNENYENALRYRSVYIENSNMSYKLYFTYIIPLISGLVLSNNGFPVFGKILIGFGALAAILFIITLVKSFIGQLNFYKLLGKNISSNIILLIIIGIPLYFLYYSFFKKKMKEDIKQIR